MFTAVLVLVSFVLIVGVILTFVVLCLCLVGFAFLSLWGCYDVFVLV